MEKHKKYYIFKGNLFLGILLLPVLCNLILGILSLESYFYLLLEKMLEKDVRCRKYYKMYEKKDVTKIKEGYSYLCPFPTGYREDLEDVKDVRWEENIRDVTLPKNREDVIR